MVKKNIKSILVPGIYVIAAIAFITSVILIERVLTVSSFKDNDYMYVIDLFDSDMPVVSSDDVIIRPYNDKSVKIVKHFYDYKASQEQQQKSLVYYEKTYMQNSGVDYSGTKENFDIISILNGTVINVMEDNTLGKFIEIRHENDLISVYQCLSETLVKKDDVINQGSNIGKSGSCNISSDLKDHLHFELFYKGQVVNPENYYDKKIKEL
ncbi:MAG: M23 family metallopeptidase [Bacilli bacterium]